MFARLKSMGLLGVDGFMIDVEADLSQGLPGFVWWACPERR